MAQINAYLNFDGNCREAMNFYKDVFNADLTLQSVEESPMAKDWPAAAQKQILHAELSNGKLKLFGSDMGGVQGFTKGHSVTLSLSCEDGKELENLFDKLAEGAKTKQPLHKFFGGTIGSLTDKFDMNWMFYHDGK